VHCHLRLLIADGAIHGTQLLPPGKRTNLSAVAQRGGKGIYAILLLALVLRLTWGMVQKSTPESLANLPDQMEYLSLGQNLLWHGSLHFHDDRFNQDVYAYRTPGYPTFVAICGANPRVIRIAQALIDTFTVVAIYLLSTQYLTPTLSLLAAAIVAFNPWLIYFTGLILSETLFTAFLAWSLLLLTKRRLAVTGCALLALSALIRPSAMGLAIVLPLITAFLNRPPRRPYHLPTTGLICLVLALLPWAYRNYRVLGTWVWTTTNAGITQYDGFNPAATGASDQRFVKSMPELSSMTEVERDQYLSRLARKYVENNLGRIVSLTVSKVARMWSPIPLSSQFSNRIYLLIGLFYTLPFFALVIAGVVRPGIPVGFKILLLAPAVYFTLVHALSVGSLRYRIPADAPMAVLAAGALARRDQKGLM